MAPKFGTSGLRGLVTELTPALITDYIRAFIAACPVGRGIYVARDLRASSPALAEVVIAAAAAEGIATFDCGAVPTPALAMVAMAADAAAVMVTGSHIPDDRNGLKFYRPDGEITKADETAIIAALGRPSAQLAGERFAGPDAGQIWIRAMVDGFGPGALAGMRVGVWSHSAVSRDLLLNALRDLGAEAIEFGRSDQFIPVDTEAVPAETCALFTKWAQATRLDAIISTDGDGDRPLVADASGRQVPGDVLGQITAALLGADYVVTPVNSNSGVELGGRFARVIRTKIGSPFVIAGMAAAPKGARVVGYEANGGFLLGFRADGPAGAIQPLATRDSLLPLIGCLYAARMAGGLGASVAAEPSRFTAADRLEHIDPERARLFLQELVSDSARDAFLAELGQMHVATDLTDGLRWQLASHSCLHLRPSGNAPEFRVYAEGESPSDAEALLAGALALVAARLAPQS